MSDRRFPGRPPGGSKRDDFFDWIRIDKLRIKGWNYDFTTLEDMYRLATDDSIKKWIETMSGKERQLLAKYGIKLKLMMIPMRYGRDKTYVYIDPPGYPDDGIWPLLPVARTVIGYAVTLALKGELLQRWDERPRFPMVQALLKFFLTNRPAGARPRPRCSRWVLLEG